MNPRVHPPGPYPPELVATIGLAAHGQAAAVIMGWPGYEPTPIVNASDLASDAGVAQVWIKDESGRFGLGSFKALGGAYGVKTVLARHPDTDLVVACASDGNHGRSVAWGAQMLGAKAVIYLPTHVTEGRAEAIRAYGADVVRVDGEYDDAVRKAQHDADERGWHVVSDTSYEGYDQIPRDVMQGYTVMAQEILDRLLEPPTHVFLQGGVGGLAAAVIGHFWQRLEAQRSTSVIVEPSSAAGLLQSVIEGRPAPALGDLHTAMAGLSCRDVSPVAWTIVEPGSAAFMTVAEEDVHPMMRRLATPAADRGTVVAGESGVAGLLGLMALAARPEWREAIGLDATSRVLAINTEGATDPELYARILRGET